MKDFLIIFTIVFILPYFITVLIYLKQGFPDFEGTGNFRHIDVVKGNTNMEHDMTSLRNSMGLSKREFTDMFPQDKYVLHHMEDGRVGMIPRDIHDIAQYGSAHVGYSAIQNSKLF